MAPERYIYTLVAQLLKQNVFCIHVVLNKVQSSLTISVLYGNGKADEVVCGGKM